MLFLKNSKPKKRWGVLAFFILVNFTPNSIEAQETHLSASLRSGVEFDDNVRRENEEQESGFLTRYFGSLQTLTEPFDSARIQFSAKHGGKFFFANKQADADTLLTQLSLSFAHQLNPQSEFLKFSYDARIDMKDRTERVPARDYNRGGVGGGLIFSLKDFRFRMGGALRYFAFKPNPSSGSSNTEIQSSAFWQISNALSLNGGYTFARRSFETERFVQKGSELEADQGVLRQDDFHSGFLSTQYAGLLVASLKYNFSVNLSNSFGQELTRHTLTGSVTAPLVLDFYGTLKIELQRTSYDDPVLIDASFQVDEDNRNAMIASLAYAFGEHWESEIRYSLFLQEFGVGSDYQRQTLFFAFAYIYD